MTLLSRGDRFLSRTAPATANETVLVLRGGNVLCEAWEASPGTTRIEILQEGEATIVGSQHDFIGDESPLQLDGLAAKFEVGDTIEWVLGAYTYVFECLPDNGEQVAVPHGRYQNRVRVHTKLIDRRSNE